MGVQFWLLHLLLFCYFFLQTPDFPLGEHAQHRADGSQHHDELPLLGAASAT
jgi:hypothetical protein